MVYFSKSSTFKSHQTEREWGWGNTTKLHKFNETECEQLEM